MENKKDLDCLIESMMEEMEKFASEVPGKNYMVYFYKIQDVMKYYDKFLNAENEEKMKEIQEKIRAEIASYYF